MNASQYQNNAIQTIRFLISSKMSSNYPTQTTSRKKLQKKYKNITDNIR